MDINEHTAAALENLEKACEHLTKAVGAFVVCWQSHPELHKRLIELSCQADELRDEVREEMGAQ